MEKQHLELEKLAKEHNVSCDSKIVKNGLASVKIPEFAKQHDIDLIIMTKTKISSRYEKQHYQSTIENVFRNAHCPILILWFKIRNNQKFFYGFNFPMSVKTNEENKT